MKSFNRIFLAAIVAGGLAGIILAGIQHFTVTPMILEAEKYENSGSDEAVSEEAVSAEHGDEAWAPEDGAERIFYTVANSVVIGIGLGLLLVACYALRQKVTWQQGILWGLAGFAAFNLAPSFGLPPELPGDAAAGLEQRQVWWLLTVLVTAVGLWIIAFQPSRYLKLFGVAIIVLPHIFGAPHPEAHGGLAPDELRQAFIITSLAANAVFWVVLGMLCAYFFNRFGESTEQGVTNPI